jgi:hypothetical protein
VFVLGTETWARMGVVPGVNGMVTDALMLLKSTPGEPGLRSVGDVPFGAPMIVALLIYCGLVIPKTELSNDYRLILWIEYIPSVSGQITVVVKAVVIAVVVGAKRKPNNIVYLMEISIYTHQSILLMLLWQL